MEIIIIFVIAGVTLGCLLADKMFPRHPKPVTTSHTWEVHKHCQKMFCPVCCGGLAICTVCQCAEGTLPTQCPGKPVPPLLQDQIHNGRIDFVDGCWRVIRGDA